LVASAARLDVFAQLIRDGQKRGTLEFKNHGIKDSTHMKRPLASITIGRKVVSRTLREERLAKPSSGRAHRDYLPLEWRLSSGETCAARRKVEEGGPLRPAFRGQQGMLVDLPRQGLEASKDVLRRSAKSARRGRKGVTGEDPFGTCLSGDPGLNACCLRW